MINQNQMYERSTCSTHWDPLNMQKNMGNKYILFWPVATLTPFLLSLPFTYIWCVITLFKICHMGVNLLLQFENNLILCVLFFFCGKTSVQVISISRCEFSKFFDDVGKKHLNQSTCKCHCVVTKCFLKMAHIY